jgi:CDP-glycerol glycerophosphotransferase
MATFSVIVTALDAQGHLRECLESLHQCAGRITGQSGAEPQVIAVDNGSVDGSGEIAEEYAERDERFHAVRLPRRQCAGEARDAGAALATGRYLLFLDGRDTLTTGALRAFAERVAETGEPDLVVFDHVRSRWWNTAIPSGDGQLFIGPGREVFSVLAQPDTLHITPTLANRLVRADFYAAHRELFTRDEYDQFLPALGSLLVADRVAILDEVCLRRSEPEAESRPEGQFNLFEQYERIWELLGSRPATAEHRDILFNFMIRRYLKVLTLPGVPEADQVEFFHRASAHFARYKPAGYQRPANLNGVRHAVLERDSYAGYKALQSANRRRRAVRTIAVKAKRSLAGRAMESAYREQLRHPIEEDLAVFSAYWDRGVTCSPAAISAKLAELAPHIRQVWVVRESNVPLIPAGIDYVIPGSRRCSSVLARAKYLVNNVNFPDSVVKRPGQIHVQTHHGTPLKRMGTDQVPFPATSRGVDYQALLERCARWDYSVSANRHSTETWERAYPVPFTSLNYGYPRNDVYYGATAGDVVRVRRRIGVAPGRNALLYAPTHRDYEAAWTPRLDLERLARDLGEGFVLLVRGHYFYDRGLSPLEKLHRQGLIIDVSQYDSIEELGLAADALITDYSSVMFDYANLDRPVVIYADDWETYSVTRGVYFDLIEQAPGAVARSQRELARLFTSGAWCDESAAIRRAEFRRRFCEFDDGHAAERVVRHVFSGLRDVPPVVPLELRTPAPSPEKAAASLLP